MGRIINDRIICVTIKDDLLMETVGIDISISILGGEGSSAGTSEPRLYIVYFYDPTISIICICLPV